MHAPPSLLRIAAVGISGLACSCSSGPPIRTASGELIEGVSYEERTPLSTEVREVAFRGDRLRSAVALLDRAGAIGMSGSYQATSVVDKSTLVLTIHAGEQRVRKILVKNCVEPHVCAFFAAAVQGELVDTVPIVCREGPLCMEPWRD